MRRIIDVQVMVALGAAAVLSLLPAMAASGRQAVGVDVTGVDDIFAEWTSETPGCTVGVDVDGETVVEAAFGQADLERGIPLGGDFILEAGSVSKQFTAAAVLLLAADGKLSLDDAIRKYIPEMPDYGTPITIRQMLTHTSGLRDWGSVAGIGGWPRTTRAYTHAHVIDILSRQTKLNFPPGTRWSYSNSGYNLAAILVARVSGMSFADFSSRRIFEPLGMTSTSWRDDFTRVVPRRALAYTLEEDGYHTEMPFEDVHGNGGLLTTVGDLLIWMRSLAGLPRPPSLPLRQARRSLGAGGTSPDLGSTSFVTEQITPGRFSDGRQHEYGLGLRTKTYRGAKEIWHSGSTAGYRAYLTTFPEHRTSVAVLCNAANANAGALTYAVVDRVLDGKLSPVEEPVAAHTLTDEEASALAGLYRDTITGAARRIIQEGSGVRVERGPVLIAESATTLVTADAERWVFDGRGGVRITDRFGTVEVIERVDPVTPAVETLRAYEGTYTSADAETTLTVALDGDALVIRRRPDTEMRLTPLYADAFSAPMGTVIFRREGSGGVDALSISQDRVWDMRFERESRRD